MRSILPEKCLVILMISLIVAVALPLTMRQTKTAAQGSSLPPPIYTGNDVQEVSWLADSKTLAFFSGLSETGSWYKYHLASSVLSQSQIWPLQPQLTASEIQTFRFAVQGNSRKAFAFTSPDARFLVSVQSSIGAVWPLVLADKSSRQVVRLMGNVSFPFTGPDYFNVLWNRTSSAFAAMVLPDEGGSGYPVLGAFVTNFRNQLSNSVLNSFITVKISNIDYAVTSAFAISNSGTQILVLVKNIDASGQNAQLALLDVANPSRSQIISGLTDKIILSATYFLNDETSLLVIDDDGLVKYDLKSAAATIINPEVNSLWARAAYLSPDGNFIAAIHTDETEQVYILNTTSAVQAR